MAGKMKHGMSRTPLYKLWLNMKDRCQNPNNPYFHNYGGRGIKVCQEWATSFPAFAAAVGERPSLAHTLDRLDNSLGYQPGNVGWATKKEQANNMRKNRVLIHDGRAQTLTQWAEEIGLAPSTLQYRLKQGGMSVTQALTTGRRSGRMPARAVP